MRARQEAWLPLRRQEVPPVQGSLVFTILIKIITRQGFIDKNAEANVLTYDQDFDIVYIMQARICVNRMKVQKKGVFNCQWLQIVSLKQIVSKFPNQIFKCSVK
jgi:uncharacterized membrane protein SirB2